MSKQSWKTGSYRTTVTINRELYEQCRETMLLHGYGNNFSSFVSEAARAQRHKLLMIEARKKAVLRSRAKK